MRKGKITIPEANLEIVHSRSFTLHANTSEEDIQAKYEEGVLN